jgi:hypothetical protein
MNRAWVQRLMLTVSPSHSDTLNSFYFLFFLIEALNSF